MSKRETSRKKMEQIAKNLLDKQKSYKDMISGFFSKNNEYDIDLENNKEKDDNEETKKDKIYIAKISYEKYLSNKKFNEENELIVKQNTIPNKKNSNDELKFCTNINTSLTDYYYCFKKNNIRVNSLVDDENEKNNDLTLKSNNNKQNTNSNKNDISKDDDSYLLKFLNNVDTKINEEINLEEYNIIYKIYKSLMNNFNFNSGQNNNNIDNNTLNVIQFLSEEAIKFIINGKINILLKYFNYSIDIMKFIFYQIYIFLSILYIDETKDFTESYQMSFKTALLYSSQNYNLLLNIISNPSHFTNQEIKTTKSFVCRNKIIYSILKTLSMRNNSISSINNIIFNNTEPRTFDNNEESIDLYKTTFKLIEEIETETKLNKTKEIKNNIYNKLKLFLVNLNKNEYLTNKMTSIEQKQDNDNIDINLETMLNEVNSEEEISTQKIFTLPLPKNEEKEYKYTIFIELDETVVHYYEEGENYFVKVRQGTDDFLSTMNEFCEIIIVSTSSKEYTDIILENLNKDKKRINTAIYKDICDSNNLILDLRKINRDIKKCIFICHDKNDFFKAPESNIIELKEFNGEEQDKEIVFLQVELMKLKIGMDDIRDIIKEINNTLEKKRNNEKEDDMENVEQRE